MLVIDLSWVSSLWFTYPTGMNLSGCLKWMKLRFTQFVVHIQQKSCKNAFYVTNISHPEFLDELKNPERKLCGRVCMCEYVLCVHVSGKKEQIKFWPSSSPGLGLIQGTFAARCDFPPTQTSSLHLSCHFTVAYCSALSFLNSFFLSPFSFSFDILTPDFQSQCDIQTKNRCFKIQRP